MNRFWAKYKRELVVALATLAMGAVFTVMNPMFLTWRNFLTILQQMVLNGILAVGMMFAIITGGIDLSIGCTFAITGISVAYCCVSGVNPYLAIVLGIVIGVLLGAFNGILINKLKLQPFIATLGTQSLYRGIAYVVTGGRPITGVPDNFRNIFNGKMLFDIRYYIIVMIVLFIVAYLVLAKTRTGAYLYAVGGNEEAAKLSGVNVVKTKYIAYIICSVCASIAGLVMLASLGSAEPTAGSGYETNAIAAAAIGGTRMAGGKGTPLGTFFGALLLAVLKVGMVVINVDSFWQFIFTGLIIIVASYFEFIQEDISMLVARKKASK